MLQVVFLVDVHSTKWSEETEVKNVLRLCALKILRYSADHLCERITDLKWGFKFFSSNALLRDYGRHEFSELNVDSFEEFELQISRRFEEEFEKANGLQQQQPANGQDGEEVAEMVGSLKPLPGKCLTYSLTELVHDFVWDKLDICSPVKGIRTGSNTDGGETRNVVFLLGNAPCDEEAMKVFTGEPVTTPESFRNALVPTALLKQLKHTCRISLFWIDTGMLVREQGRTQDELCKLAVQTFVKEIGGALIPMSSLLYIGNKRNALQQDVATVFTDGSALCERTSSTGSLAIPFSSAMNYYVGQLMDGQSDTSSSLLGPVEIADLWSGWLFSGSERQLHCVVKLSPLFTHTTTKMRVPASTFEQKDAAVISFSLNEAKENNNETRAKCKKAGKEQKTGSRERVTAISNSGQQGIQDSHITITLKGSENKLQLSETEVIAKTTTQPNYLWIGGVVKRCAVCPSWLHPTQAYSVIGMAHCDTDQQTGTALSTSTQTSGHTLSGWFQELLLALAGENLLMVLEFYDPVTKFPVTGLLQPLTSVCGIISIINSDMLIMVEKLLLLQRRGITPGARTPSDLMKEGSPHELKTARIKHHELETRPLEHGEVHCHVNAKCVGHGLEKGVVGHFSSGNMETWTSCLGCSAQVSSLWKHLECRQEEEDEEGALKESALIRELKKLYSSKRNTASSGDQPPKQPSTNVKQLENTSVVRLEAGSAHSKEHFDAIVHEKRQSSEDECRRGNKLDAAEERHSKGNTADPIVQSVDFKDEEDMSSFLTEKYLKLLSEGSEMLTDVKEMTAVISGFMAKSFPENEAKISTAQFIRDRFIAQNASLKEKYQLQNEPSVENQKIREYKLQILLRMEVALLVEHQSDELLIDEVTVMLRAISFLTDPASLGTYMREVLVQRYGGQIPKFLCAVYEGLMQDPPRELLSPSQVPTEDISPLKRMSVKPSSMSRQDSDQPRSSGGRALTRHMSVSDVGGKRREIVVPGKLKVKNPQQKKEKQHTGNNADEGSKEKTAPGRKKIPVKKVRRNLFTEDGSANKPDKASRLKLKKNHKQRLHGRHSVPGVASNIVQETPVRKQISNALWQQQHRARRRTCTSTEVEVVLESPIRNVKAGDHLPRRSPRSSAAVLQRSQSFYGRSASARPLTRTKSFTAVGSRQSPGKVPSEPDDGQATMVSPLRVSPSAKKRFALHSLLTSVCNSGAQRANRKPGAPPSNAKTAVRSSPRLFKKRSFSCIGFSTSVPLGASSPPVKTREAVERQLGSSDWETVADIITTPRKTHLLSPVRRSPRLKQQNFSGGETVKDKPEFKISVENSAITSTGGLSSEGLDGSLATLGDETRVSENEPVKELCKSDAKNLRSKVQTPAKDAPTTSRLGSLTLTKGSLTEKCEIDVSVKTPHASTKKTPSKGGRGSAIVGTSPHSSKSPSRRGEELVCSKGNQLKHRLYASEQQADTSPVNTPSGHTSQGNESQSAQLNAQIEDVEEDPWISREQAEFTQVLSAGENQVNRRHSPLESRRCHLSEGKELSVVLADLLKSPQVPSSCWSPRNARDTPQGSPGESSQLLLRDRPGTPNLATRGNRKRAVTSTGSPSVETERLSPLNQILKQQKRKRDDVSKASKDVLSPQSAFREAKSVLQSEKSVQRETVGKTKRNTAALEVATSRTSSEENDWLSEIEKELEKAASSSGKKNVSCARNENESSCIAPPRKRRRINKSKVFGISTFREGAGKTKRLAMPSTLSNSDLNFEDDILKCSPVHRRSKSKTPISAVSLKILQESPILCNDSLSSDSSPSASIGRKFGDSQVSGHELSVSGLDSSASGHDSSEGQLKYRHFRKAKVLVREDSLESLDIAAELEANTVHRVNLRKRLKLGTMS